MTDKPQVLRDTDDEARHLARLLLRGARHMALAVLEPQTGFPAVSRALTGTDLDGVPVILVSALAGHTKGLTADPRASLLAGEPGKGDPLAHPRITVQCLAEPVARDSAGHGRIRRRFLDRHPKAALYADFPDFGFFRLMPQSAALNGGFGRAYALTAADLLIPPPVTPEEWLELQERLSARPQLAEKLAAQLGLAGATGWRLAGIDPGGFDLAARDVLVRHEFGKIAASPQQAVHEILTRSEAGAESESGGPIPDF